MANHCFAKISSLPKREWLLVRNKVSIYQFAYINRPVFRAQLDWGRRKSVTNAVDPEKDNEKCVRSDRKHGNRSAARRESVGTCAFVSRPGMASAVTRVVHRCEDAQETGRLGTSFTCCPVRWFNTFLTVSHRFRQNSAPFGNADCDATSRCRNSSSVEYFRWCSSTLHCCWLYLWNFRKNLEENGINLVKNEWEYVNSQI